MKKHLSVLMLIVRSTFYKVLGVILLMCGAQFGLFALTVNRLREKNSLSLEFAVEKSYISIILFAAFMAVFLLLASTGRIKKHRTDYTLNRLQISENGIFFWQALYNTLIFALLFFVQIAMALFLCSYYAENSGDNTVTHQTVFLAFYRNAFFHSMLPFNEPHSIAANIVTLFTVGLSSALLPMIGRHSRGTDFLVYLSLWTAIYTFRRDLGDFIVNLLIYLVAAIILCYTIYFLLTKEVHHGK